MTPQCGDSADRSPTKIATGLNWRSFAQIQIEVQRMHFVSNANALRASSSTGNFKTVAFLSFISHQRQAPPNKPLASGKEIDDAKNLNPTKFGRSPQTLCAIRSLPVHGGASGAPLPAQRRLCRNCINFRYTRLRAQHRSKLG